MNPGSESRPDGDGEHLERGYIYSSPILSAEKVWGKRDAVNEPLLHYALRAMIEEARRSIVEEIGARIPHAYYYDPGRVRDVTHEHIVTVPRRAARTGFGSTITAPHFEDRDRLREQDIEDALDNMLGINVLSTKPANPRDLAGRGIFAVRPEYEKGKFRGALTVSRAERIEDGDGEYLGRFKDVTGVKPKDATHLTWCLTRAIVIREVAPILLNANSPRPPSLHLVNIPEALRSASGIPTSLESILRHVRGSVRRTARAA